MKHKKFNEPYPYTYYVTHIPTRKSYYGLRVANSTGRSRGVCKCSPLEDLGKQYYTSIGKYHSWFKERLKTHPSEFKVKIHYTFDTPEETYVFEKNMIKQLIRKQNWLNKMTI